MLVPLLIIALVIFLPILIASGVVWTMNRQHLRFINPITKSLRRPPGAQLGRRLGGEQVELGFSLLEMILPGFIPVLVYIQTVNQSGGVLRTGYIVIVVTGWLAWEIYAGYNWVRRVKRIKTLRLAYECELVMGQELDLPMLHGFHVFHVRILSIRSEADPLPLSRIDIILEQYERCHIPAVSPSEYLGPTD